MTRHYPEGRSVAATWCACPPRQEDGNVRSTGWLGGCLRRRGRPDGGARRLLCEVGLGCGLPAGGLLGSPRRRGGGDDGGQSLRLGKRQRLLPSEEGGGSLVFFPALRAGGLGSLIGLGRPEEAPPLISSLDKRLPRMEKCAFLLVSHVLLVPTCPPPCHAFRVWLPLGCPKAVHKYLPPLQCIHQRK